MALDREGDTAAESAPARSSEDWGLRFRRGDPEAVGTVRERVGKILAYKGLGIGHRERDDLQQEVLAELWQAVNRTGFDFTAGFWGFVEVVTARRCIDWLRTKRETEPIDETYRDSGKGPLRATLDHEKSELVRRALSELDESDRELILMRLRDDLSYAEISEQTGKTAGALRIQMYRSVQKAGKILERLAPERGGGQAKGDGS